jgi:hypothetical protein
VSRRGDYERRKRSAWALAPYQRFGVCTVCGLGEDGRPLHVRGYRRSNLRCFTHFKPNRITVAAAAGSTP